MARQATVKLLWYVRLPQLIKLISFLSQLRSYSHLALVTVKKLSLTCFTGPVWRPLVFSLLTNWVYFILITLFYIIVWMLRAPNILYIYFIFPHFLANFRKKFSLTFDSRQNKWQLGTDASCLAIHISILSILREKMYCNKIVVQNFLIVTIRKKPF